jgi:hypothetical protein
MIGAQRQRSLGGRDAVEPRSGEVLFLGSDLYILR